MNYDQSKTLLGYIEIISASLAQLVLIQQQRLDAYIKHMTIDDSLLQKVVDAINVALEAESKDEAAVAAKDTLITSLRTQLAPNPALLASVQDALSKALAANPPVVVPPD